MQTDDSTALGTNEVIVGDSDRPIQPRRHSNDLIGGVNVPGPTDFRDGLHRVPSGEQTHADRRGAQPQKSIQIPDELTPIDGCSGQVDRLLSRRHGDLLGLNQTDDTASYLTMTTPTTFDQSAIDQQNPNRAGAYDRSVRLYVGCAMWAQRQWVGRWFPPTTPTGRELEVYATWCTSVEGNTTHYASPKPATVARWAEMAPEYFRFCFKVPRSITHEKRLRNVATEVEDFLVLLEPLVPNLGPVQLQLPASFGPDDIGVLADTCQNLPRSVEWAVETRHRDFSAGGSHERELNDLLARAGINRVILDSRTLFSVPARTPLEREAWERKPRLPVRPVATGSQPLVRLIGATNPRATIDGWSQWVPKIAEWCRQGVTPHVFIHTPDNHDTPSLARYFHADVAALVPGLEALPQPLQAEEQLGMFG